MGFHNGKQRAGSIAEGVGDGQVVGAGFEFVGFIALHGSVVPVECKGRFAAGSGCDKRGGAASATDGRCQAEFDVERQCLLGNGGFGGGRAAFGVGDGHAVVAFA